MNRIRRRPGFTMSEVIVVLCIVAILAAIAVPSLVAYIENGRQINRMNIARTIYLSAQNQLTEMKIMGQLSELEPLENTNKVIDQPNHGRDTASWLDDAETRQYVVFLSKPAGVMPTGFMARLLSPLMDNEVASSAILIEFNIKTGVVLSAFYSDMPGAAGGFVYGGGGRNDVSGPLGMDVRIPISAQRRQGYYGVNETGVLPPDVPDISINIIDTYDDYGMYGDDVFPSDFYNHSDYDYEGDRNILFARIGITAENGGESFTVSISGLNRRTVSFIPDELDDPSYFAPEDERVYVESYDADNGYLIAWILDYVTGDTVTEGGDIRLERFDDGTDRAFENPGTPIAVEVINNDIGSKAESFARHPYCSAGSGIDDTYYIGSARHLYNIRHVIGSANKYIQMANIDLADLGKAPDDYYNFDPIYDTRATGGGSGAFLGKFDGNSNVISNLAISLDFPEMIAGDAGLFARIGANSEVSSLVLENPGVTTSDGNAGAVCGVNDGTIDAAYVIFSGYDPVNYSSIDVSTISGTEATGGIAGINNGEVLNTTFISPYPAVHILGNPDATGGIVGENGAAGTIEYVQFLALAPMKGTEISPVAAINDSAEDMETAYYLSGGYIWPTEAPPRDGGYNTETNIGIGKPMTSYQIYTDVYEEFAGLPNSVWERYDSPGELLESDIIDYENNDVYPYPFIPVWVRSTIIQNVPQTWPVAGGARTAFIEYYEKYEDTALRSGNNSWGYSSDGTLITAFAPDVKVLNDGYSIRVTRTPGSGYYNVAIGEETLLSFRITEPAPGATAIEYYDSSGLLLPASPPAFPYEYLTTFSAIPGEDDDQWVRIYLPNDRLKDIYLAAYGGGKTDVNANIKISVTYAPGLDAENQDEVISLDVNPLFPLPAQTSVRSPRHIDNIDAAGIFLYRTYSQLFNVDFIAYRMGLTHTAGAGKPALDNVGFDYNEAAVNRLNGPFAGSYNGNNRLISNLAIDNSENGDYIGLFAVNSGTIENTVLSNPYIKGRDYTGGIAGSNTNVIKYCTVQTSVSSASIEGRGNVGGIAGSSTSGAAITFCSVQTAVSLPGSPSDPFTVKGTEGNVGGIAGINTGTLTDVYLISNSNTAAVQGSVAASTGGIAGTTSSEINRALYLARIQSSVNSLTGSGTVNNGRILAREGTGDFYSLNRSQFSQANYNDGADTRGKTITIHNINITGWAGWTKIQQPNDGLGAITENDLLINERNRTLGYPYPCFTTGPQPSIWPLVGVSTSPYRMAYYERYAGTDYVGFWANESSDTLLYPNSPLLSGLGLTNETLYVIEEGYVFLTPMGGTGNNDQMSLYSRSGATILGSSPNSFGSTNVPGQMDNINFFIIGGGSTNPETYMQGNDLVRFRVEFGGIPPYEGWINLLYGKAIYPLNANGNYTYPTKFNGTYSIRSPRQLENIGKALDGNFVQEININLRTDSLRDLPAGLPAANYHTGSGYPITGTSLYTKFYYTNRNGNNNFNYVSEPLGYTNAATQAVVAGSFTGTYTARYKPPGYGSDHISKLYYGPYTANTAPPAEDANQIVLNKTGANVGIFQNIAAGGRISDLVLENINVRNTGTGTVGGLAGTNAGSISNIEIRHSSVGAAAGTAGGVAAANSGNISNVVLVSSSASSPVSAASGNAGGIVGDNKIDTAVGTIRHVQYIAIAPNDGGTIYPITRDGNGTIDEAYYLSGTHSKNNKLTDADAALPLASYNTSQPGGGITADPAASTTRALNNKYGTATWPGWQREITLTDLNTVFNDITLYPYMRLAGSAHPMDWPLASNISTAATIAYFEIYSDSSMGFYSPGYDSSLPEIRTDEMPVDAGYCAIVPEEGEYDVRQASSNENVRIPSQTYSEHSAGLDYVVIPQEIGTPGAGESAVEVIVNDRQVKNPDARCIDARFAYSVYGAGTVEPAPEPADEEGGLVRMAAFSSSPAVNTKTIYIRTAQQMCNISGIDTSDIMFVQEVDIDFGGHTLDSSAVSCDFGGTYDGNGKAIYNLSISSTGDNVGLFSRNSGTIKNVRLLGADIRGDSNVGGIAGHNNEGGSIFICSVEESSVRGEGGSIGGVAGRNDGEVEDVYFLSTSSPKESSPVRRTGSGKTEPGHNVGGIVGRNNGEVTRALYLAPAPSIKESGERLIYPIIGGGKDAKVETYKGEEFDETDPLNVIRYYGYYKVETTFFLHGEKSFYYDGKRVLWPSDPPESATRKVRYNYGADSIENGGAEADGYFLKLWMLEGYFEDFYNSPESGNRKFDNDWKNWFQPQKIQKTDESYRYPILQNEKLSPSPKFPEYRKWPIASDGQWPEAVFVAEGFEILPFECDCDENCGEDCDCPCHTIGKCGCDENCDENCECGCHDKDACSCGEDCEDGCGCGCNCHGDGACEGCAEDCEGDCGCGCHDSEGGTDIDEDPEDPGEDDETAEPTGPAEPTDPTEPTDPGEGDDGTQDPTNPPDPGDGETPKGDSEGGGTGGGEDNKGGSGSGGGEKPKEDGGGGGGSGDGDDEISASSSPLTILLPMFFTRSSVKRKRFWSLFRKAKKQ